MLTLEDVLMLKGIATSEYCNFPEGARLPGMNRALTETERLAICYLTACQSVTNKLKEVKIELEFSS